MVAGFVAEHGDMAVEKIDGEEASYQAMLAAAQSLPFLASKKLVLLRNPSASKEFTENFEQFVGDIAETNDVIIVESKLDKRLAYYKNLKKLTDFHEFRVLDANGLARYAVEVAKEQGAVLSSADARYLVERVGTNQLMIQHEVQKLALADTKITRATIELLTDKTPQSTVFDLLEVAFAGNAPRMTELYEEQRALKVEPQQVIAMLAWQLHILLLVKAAGQKTAETIATDAKISPYVVRKTMQLARGLSYKKLQECTVNLRELDERTKTDGTNADEAVRYFLLLLAQK